MATVSGLVDAAVGEARTCSSPFRRRRCRRRCSGPRTLPIVFNYVADPIAAGAGTSDTAHAAERDRRVPHRRLRPDGAAASRAYLPNVRVLGTVYVPAEVNMVSQLAVMQKAVARGRHRAESRRRELRHRGRRRGARAHRGARRRDLPDSRQPDGGRRFPSIAQVGAAGARADLRVPERARCMRGAVAAHGARLLRQRTRGGEARRARHARRVAGAIPFVGFSENEVDRQRRARRGRSAWRTPARDRRQGRPGASENRRMEITQTVTDGRCSTSRVDGRLDGYWSDHLERALAEAIGNGHHRIRLDCSSSRFLSSAGIGVLVKFHKRARQDRRRRSRSSTRRSRSSTVLTMTQPDAACCIEPAAADAAAAAAAERGVRRVEQRRRRLRDLRSRRRRDRWRVAPSATREPARDGRASRDECCQPRAGAADLRRRRRRLRRQRRRLPHARSASCCRWPAPPRISRPTAPTSRTT